MERLVVNNKRLVMGVILIVCGVIGGVPLTPTVRLWGKYGSLNTQVKEIKEVDTELTDYTKYAHLNQEIEPVTQIFEVLGVACADNKVMLMQIFPSKNFVDNNRGVLIRTQQITLQGETGNMLRCLNAVQKKSSSVKIVCIKFEKVKLSKVDVLLGHIYFQNVNASEI